MTPGGRVLPLKSKATNWLGLPFTPGGRVLPPKSPGHQLASAKR